MLRSTITGGVALGALVALSGLAIADETVIEKRTYEETAPARERVIEERRVEQPPAVEKRTEKTVVKDKDDNDNADVDVDVDVND